MVESALGVEAPLAVLPVSGGSCNWPHAIDPSQQPATRTPAQTSRGSRREALWFGRDRGMSGS
jgi:hypothetical protein